MFTLTPSLYCQNWRRWRNSPLASEKTHYQDLGIVVYRLESDTWISIHKYYSSNYDELTQVRKKRTQPVCIEKKNSKQEKKQCCIRVSPGPKDHSGKPTVGGKRSTVWDTKMGRFCISPECTSEVQKAKETKGEDSWARTLIEHSPPYSAASWKQSADWRWRPSRCCNQTRQENFTEIIQTKHNGKSFFLLLWSWVIFPPIMLHMWYLKVHSMAITSLWRAHCHGESAYPGMESM